MSSIIDEELLLKCLRNVYPDSSITLKNYQSEKVVFEPGSNYTSEVLRASVQFECNEVEMEEFLLFKLTFIDDRSEELGTQAIFIKESYLYETVFPKMPAITKHLSVPKFYYTIPESNVLVLEDLTKQGYYMMSQATLGLNFEQSVSVLQELGKFHAFSVKFNRLYPAEMEPVIQETFYTRPLAEWITKRLLPMMLQVLRGLESAPVLISFASYEEKISRTNLCKITNPFHEFNVLNHSNLKIPNILFKDDETGRPISVKLLDFQTCRWNSPALDLIFFYVNSVDFSVFKEHHEELLDSYLSSLNETLAELKCESAYSKEAYLADLEGCRPYQVYTLLWIGLRDLGKAGRLKVFMRNDPLTEEEVLEIRSSEAFRNRFFHWFSYFKERGFFNL